MRRLAAAVVVSAVLVFPGCRNEEGRQSKAFGNQQRSVSQVVNTADKERDALLLLGKATAHESVGCESLAELTELGPRIESILSTRGLVGLPDIVKFGAVKCPGFQFVITVTENPDVAEIQRVFGKTGQIEEGRLAFGANSQNVTWHKYAWLHFAVVGGKVIAVRGDSKGLPAESQNR